MTKEIGKIILIGSVVLFILLSSMLINNIGEALCYEVDFSDAFGSIIMVLAFMGWGFAIKLSIDEFRK